MMRRLVFRLILLVLSSCGGGTAFAWYFCTDLCCANYDTRTITCKAPPTTTTTLPPETASCPSPCAPCPSLTVNCPADQCTFHPIRLAPHDRQWPGMTVTLGKYACPK